MDDEKTSRPEGPLPSGNERRASTPGDSGKEAALVEAKTRPERTANFNDYLRVFTYATTWDFLAYAAGVFASIGAGVTLPLMQVNFLFAFLKDIRPDQSATRRR